MSADIVAKDYNGDEAEAEKKSKKYKQLQKKKKEYEQQISEKCEKLLKRKKSKKRRKKKAVKKGASTDEDSITEEPKKKAPAATKKKKIVKKKKAKDTFNLDDLNALRERARKAFEESQQEIKEEHELAERRNRSRKSYVQPISLKEWTKQIQNQVNQRTQKEDGEDLLGWMDEFHERKERIKELDKLMTKRQQEVFEETNDSEKYLEDDEYKELLEEQKAAKQKMESRQNDYVKFCIDTQKKG